MSMKHCVDRAGMGRPTLTGDGMVPRLSVLDSGKPVQAERPQSQWHVACMPVCVKVSELLKLELQTMSCCVGAEN